MGNFKLSLASLISEIINEVGDLKNINPYNYQLTKYPGGIAGNFWVEFPSGKQEMADVIIESIDPSNKIDIELPPVFEINDPKIKGFSIAYTIGNEDAQFDKSDLKTYVKVMATVVNIVKEVVSDNEKKYYKPLYLFLSTSKTGEMGTQDTKLKYYQAILNNNLPSGYRMGKGKFAGMDIIAIQKIKD
jgi:hypothetical protein